MKSSLEELKSVGFEKLGQWTLKNSELSLEINNHRLSKISPALYAFTIKNNVMYVGKTNQELSSRLYGYKNPGESQKTNLRINSKIKGKLTQHERVDVYVFHELTRESRGVFPLNLPAALEDGIIEKLQPDWNENSKQHKSKDSLGNSSRNNQPQSNFEPTSVAEVPIGPTYLTKGFFNLGVESEKHIGNDGDEIKIHFGNESGSINGKINRSCNQNGTPRLMGGAKLRDWIETNFHDGEVMKVDIIGPNEIMLNKLIS